MLWFRRLLVRLWGSLVKDDFRMLKWFLAVQFCKAEGPVEAIIDIILSILNFYSVVLLLPFSYCSCSLCFPGRKTPANSVTEKNGTTKTDISATSTEGAGGWTFAFCMFAV